MSTLFSQVERLTLVFLLRSSDVAVNELGQEISRTKNFPEVRKWIVSNLDNDTTVLLRRIYDCSVTNPWFLNSIPAAVLVLAKYQYQMSVRSRSRDKYACVSNRNYGGV